MNKFEIFNVNCAHCVKKIKAEIEDAEISEDLKYIKSAMDEDELSEILDELGFRLGKKIKD